MKVEVKDVSAVEKMVEIEVPAERVDDEIEDAYKEVMKEATIPGFRQGKVPRKVIERKFRDYVYQTVMQKLVEETLETGLDRKGIKPVVQPVIDPSEVEPGKNYVYTAHVEVKPEVEVTDYKGLEIFHTAREVAEEDVESALESVRERAAIIREPQEDRPVKADDEVTADVSIEVEGEDNDTVNESEEVISLWRESWIPGLTGRLEGRRVGDEVDFTEDIPEAEGIPDRFRGKTLTFSFKIKVIKERELPELDDEFAKEYSKHETFEEMKDSIREGLTRTVEQENRARLEDVIIEELIKKNPVEVPPTLVKGEATMLARNFMAGNMQKKPRDEDVEKLTGMFKDRALMRLQVNFLMEAISALENIEADESEVEEKIKEQAQTAGMHPDKFKARIEPGQQEAIKLRVVMDKTLDFLVDHANIKTEDEKVHSEGESEDSG